MEPRQRANRLQLVCWEFGVAWASLDAHLDQLTDDECVWEPATPCWNVRRKPTGGWFADWQVPLPDPAPITTIGWRTWHIGRWWSDTLDSTFDGDIDRDADLLATSWPGDAELTVLWLRRLHRQWRDALDSLGEDDLDAFDRSCWLQRGTKPLAHLLVWVNAELTRSAAEIGVLRNLYANAGAGSRHGDTG